MECPHEPDILKLPAEIQCVLFTLLWNSSYKSLGNLACANKQIRHNILAHLFRERREHGQFRWNLRKLYALGVDDETIIAILSDESRIKDGALGLMVQWRMIYSFPGNGEGLGFSNTLVTPLRTAAARGSHEMVGFLLEKRYEPLTTEIIASAVLANEVNLAERLMDTYLDSIKTSRDRKARKNDMLLKVFRAAVFAGREDMVSRLLEHNSHQQHRLLNFEDQYGHSSLYYAMLSTERVWKVMQPYLTSRGAVLRRLPCWGTEKILDIDRHRLSRVLDSKSSGDEGTPLAKASLATVTRDPVENANPPDLEIDSSRQVSDLIYNPNANCSLGDGAEGPDTTIRFIKEKINAMDHDDAVCAFGKILQKDPQLLGMVEVLSARSPDDFTGKISTQLLWLITRLRAKGLSLDFEGCRELLMGQPISFGAYRYM